MKKEKLNNELERIDALLKRVRESLKNAPKGWLRCQMVKGKYAQYYHVLDEEKEKYPQGRYLKKTEIKLAKALAQKEYDKKMLTFLLKKKKTIEYFLFHYSDDNLKSVFEKLPEAKRRLVEPYVLSDEEYLKVWYENHPGGANGFPIEGGFLTEKGEMVRSKTEKIIADKLFYMGIPYVYEAQLKLNSNRIVFPDFTLLNVKTRKTIYLEHFGMMDEADYCKKALEKLELYEANGILAGENFLYTMESKLKSISMRYLENLLERHLS